MLKMSHNRSLLPREVEVSTVHSQTVENNSITAYGHLSWNVNILGRQRFVKGLSTVS